MRRATRILSTALITAGIVLSLDAVLTLVWQEPVSAAYGRLKQAQADSELNRIEDAYPSEADLKAINGVAGDVRRARILARRFAERAAQGDPIGRIRIDSIGLDMVLLQGTDTATLQQGPGHYETTPFPGEPGTVGIAGHRTTYLAPFRKINEIEPGDTVELRMPYATFTYVVQKYEIVDPTDVEIVDPVDYQRLVLTACHPLYSAAQRWAVFARLRGIESVGGG